MVCRLLTDIWSKDNREMRAGVSEVGGEVGAGGVPGGNWSGRLGLKSWQAASLPPRVQ